MNWENKKLDFGTKCLASTKFSLLRQFEESNEMNKDVLTLFVIFGKAFDSVNINKMWKFLTEYEAPEKYTCNKNRNTDAIRGIGVRRKCCYPHKVEYNTVVQCSCRRAHTQNNRQQNRQKLEYIWESSRFRICWRQNIEMKITRNDLNGCLTLQTTL